MTRMKEGTPQRQIKILLFKAYLLLLANCLIPTSFAWLASPRCSGIKSISRCSTFDPIISRRFLSQNNNDESSHSAEGCYLESVLRDHDFDSRLVTLSTWHLPLLAEFQDQGQAQICSIIDLLFDNEKIKLQLELGDGNRRMVDLGQLTTIWQEHPFSSSSENNQIIPEMCTEDTLFPLGHVDQVLDQLYNSRVGRSRRSSSGSWPLTKKQVSKLVAESPASEDRDLVEQVLRQVVKTGSGYVQLVDSSVTMDVLFDETTNNNTMSSTLTNNYLQQRAVAANALAKDAQSGGRFKRMPCTLVSSSPHHQIITLVNGGWMVLDQSVRAASEARKFAENGPRAITLADERIAHRLECLAMGDDGGDDDLLELDVRETLKAMKLSLTPEGAKEALIQIGRWSSTTRSSSKESSKDQQKVVNPWSQSILQAAEWYKELDQQRRRRMHEAVQRGDETTDEILEGRVDLTKLPCVCVDAARTSFRDDAIGVRLRASTGRKVNPEASKWEILLHIADVSDIYAPPETTNISDDPNTSQFLKVLGEAAASRGISRYDLPLGPLHLLPPVVLQSLALETVNPDLTSRTPIQMNHSSTNRCVTVWVYIDERSGKLLDAGLERSVISCPLALSFNSATALLEGSLLEKKDDAALAKARAILGVAERNLRRWSEYHREQSEAAQAREKRLAAREMIGTQVYGTNKRDDGREGFQRTRGHRLVDTCLEIYGYTMNIMLKRAKASVPFVAGTGTDRLGRIATAPLRRYVDGMAQRQALSVLCDYGGRPLTKAECAEAGKRATEAINTISNIISSKNGVKGKNVASTKQRKAVRALKSHIMINNKRPVQAMSTGKQSEVVILGVGAVATCMGIKGTLKPGAKVMVRINRIDEENGKVSAVLVGPP